MKLLNLLLSVFILFFSINLNGQTCPPVSDETFAFNGDGTATVSWSALSGVTNYYFRYRLKNSNLGWYNRTGGTTQRQLNHILSGREFEYQMRSYCGGWKSWSEKRYFSVPSNNGTYNCGDPQAVITTNNNGTIDLEWDAISGATNYQFMYRQIGTSSWTYLTNNSTSRHLTNIQPDKMYQYYLRSYCLNGWALLSSQNYGTFIIPTQNPNCSNTNNYNYPDDEAIVFNGNGTVTMNWSAVSGATNYQLRYRVKSEGDYYYYLNGNSTQRIIQNLIPGEEYEYHTRTRCGTSWKPFGSRKYISVPANNGVFECTNPNEFITYNADGTVTMQWTAIPGATNYQLLYRIKNGGTGWTYKTSNTTTRHLADIQPDVEYEYYLRSRCQYGWLYWDGLKNFTYSSTGLNDSDCTDLINPPFSEDLFNETSPCDPTNGIIYTYSEFQNSSQGVTDIFGVPVEDIERDLTINHNSQVSDNVVDMLSSSLGTLTPEQLVECFDVLCSPQLQQTQQYFDMFLGDLNNSNPLSPGQISNIINEVKNEPGTDAPQNLNESHFTTEMGAGITPYNLEQTLANSLNSLNNFGGLEGILSEALGVDCASDSPWGDWEVEAPTPLTSGDELIGKGLQKKLEQTMESVLQQALMEEDISDPNWFLGEIEGLGMASPSNLMPSPSATNTINSVQSGVNLYNGSGYFNFPLDNISSKDVSVPIAVNGNPGGLKVDDQEGLLGSNMDISAGGKITRVVKGLPDEFYGDISGLAYGQKKGIRPIVEFSGVDLGVDVAGPKWLKSFMCKIFQLILEDLLNINISGSCLINDGVVNEFLTTIGADPLASQPLDDLLNGNNPIAYAGGIVSNVTDFLNNEFGIGVNDDILDFDSGLPANTQVGVKLFWKPIHANYANLRLLIAIPIAGEVKLTIAINFRAGFKVVNMPSEVEITKKGIGYAYLQDFYKMTTLNGLPTLDINTFKGLDKDEKLQYLTKQYPTRKRSDDEFFSPDLYHMQEVLANIHKLFNTDENNPYPVYDTEQLDLEPDEYYYEFGGYSGKFYLEHKLGEESLVRPILVPWQDFKIEVNQEYNDNTEQNVITGFTFTTPEGVTYTFDIPSYSKYDSYTLPTSFRYPEDGNYNKKFKKPEMGKVEYPVYNWWMGKPNSMEIRKDFMTNYYIEKGNKYISTWYVRNIKSEITEEEIDFTYVDKKLKYNASKNWSHTFPDFKKTGSGTNMRFETEPDNDFGFEFKTTEWKNGFANLTYSITEVEVDELLVKTIDNNRGKMAEFFYEEDNKSIVGGSLCTKVQVYKNGDEYKGWVFGYESPTEDLPEVECVPQNQNQGPVFAIDGEYKLNFELGTKDINGRFFYNFPMRLNILDDCISFVIPVKIKRPIKDHDPNGYGQMNSISELGSLLHLKGYLDEKFPTLGLSDEKEADRFRGEMVRNFLQTVKEIGEDKPIVSLTYNGTPNDLPKRFSIDQDIWGYNRESTSKSPFIKKNYTSIFGDNNGFNTDHFAFWHPDVSKADFANGRSWEADLENSKLGQISKITLETGAFLEYKYSLNQFPSGSFFSEGGLRIKSLARGSSNGTTNTAFYKYEEPTIVNFPVFQDRHQMDEYYENKQNEDFELKVKTGWKPLNEWQMNKGGCVGYGKVTELIHEASVPNLDPQNLDTGDNGKVVHYFTTPTFNVSDASVINPQTRELSLRQRRFINWTEGNFTSDKNNAGYHSPFAPLIVKDWRFGLEEKTEVYDFSDNLLSKTTTGYHFEEMGEEEGYSKLHFPKSQMFQFMYYGSHKDLIDDGALFQLVDAGTTCPKNTIINLVGYLLKTFVITEHPYRYIDKDFYVADMYVVTEKTETTNSETVNNFFKDGVFHSSNSTTTTTTYDTADPEERKLLSTLQTFSSGQSVLTEYEYADDYDQNSSYTYSPTYSFIDKTISAAMNFHNYEVPIGQFTTLNGALTSGSITAFQFLDNKYLPKTVWGVREGNVVLTGKFDEYDDGMPTRYSLAKFGTSSDPAAYGFFPEITMKWKPVNLLLEERTMSGFTTTNYFNNLCQLEYSIDVNGLKTDYTYDSRRRLKTVAGPDGLQTQTYDYVMEPLTITTTTSFNDATPSQSQIQEMDGWGNVKATKRTPLNATLTTTTYDNLFRPKVQTQLGGGEVAYTYETSPLSRVIETIDTESNTTKTKYLGPDIPTELLDLFPEGAGGYRTFAGTEMEDANGHKSYGWVDAFGKGTVSISGAGGVTVSTYDSRERVKEITNPIGEKYSYGYNTQTGLLAQKQIPGRDAPEKYWYDMSLRMVAKTDANGNTLVMDYDDIYRLVKIGYSPGASFAGHLSGTPLAEESVNGSLGDIVLENTYVTDRMWIEQVKEGILVGGGVNGHKIMDYDLDDYGRAEKVTSTYEEGWIVTEDFTPLNAAGLSTDVNRKVTGVGDPMTIDYKFTFDDILRTTMTSLTYDGETKVVDQLVFNGLDQVKQKIVGGGLQTVDYDYDGIGRLVRINSPIESGCIEEVEACQLYWGTAGTSDQFNDELCGKLTAVRLDGVVYTLPTPLPASQTSAIEAFINAKIKAIGKVGGCEFHYQNIIGQTEVHISIMKTNIQSAQLIFETCGYTLQSKDCCNIIVMDGDILSPIPNIPPNPDLFFEQITYDGLDISLIEMVGSCTAGLIKNHYSYDGDHRLTAVQNELFNPEKIKGAFSTSYSYDEAGNIMTLMRNGWVGGAEQPRFMEIDNMKYFYEEVQGTNQHTSKLEKIYDRYDKDIPDVEEFAQPVGFRGAQEEINDDGFFHAGVANYGYDGNGNMISDSGKGMGASYNLLNLPSSVMGITNEYTFSAEKIKKNGEDGERIYLAGAEFVDNKLEQINILNGRIYIEENGEKHYQYNLSDHLGNVVVVFEDKGDFGIKIEEDPEYEGEIIQRNHYYSFGMRVETPHFNFGVEPENKYLYNGKELADDFGLDWHFYGFRMYDAAIGRFPSVDPIIERFSYLTPYNYASNNPVLMIDLWGLQGTVFYGGGAYVHRNTMGDPLNNSRLEADKAGMKGAIDIATDEIPFVGEGKAIAQGDYWGVAIGAIPVVGTVINYFRKGRKKAKQAQKGFEKFKDCEICPQDQKKLKGGSLYQKGKLEDFRFSSGHEPEIIEKSHTYNNRIKNLSDEDLIKTLDPSNSEWDPIQIKRGVILRGNNRLYEIQKRGLDKKVEFEYIDMPDNNSNYFFDYEG